MSSTTTSTSAAPSSPFLAHSMDHLLDVVIVTEKGGSSEKCGHRLRLEKFMALSSRNECPVCGASIGLIQDAAAIISDHDDDDVVAFKHGKQQYRLALDTRRQQLFQRRRSNLAQDRIVKVLQLHPSSLKILHKGKVLNETTEGNMSQKLLELSSSSSSSSSSQVPLSSLVIMGTRVGQELKGGPSVHFQTNLIQFLVLCYTYTLHGMTVVTQFCLTFVYAVVDLALGTMIWLYRQAFVGGQQQLPPP